jgi:serine/threonine protein kinase
MDAIIKVYRKEEGYKPQLSEVTVESPVSSTDVKITIDGQTFDYINPVEKSVRQVLESVYYRKYVADKEKFFLDVLDAAKKIVRNPTYETPSDRLTAVENITKALQKEIKNCDKELKSLGKLGIKSETDVAKALIITAHKKAYQNAILITNTLF